MGILVVDVGSSSVRASVVGSDGTVGHAHSEPVVTTTPAPSFVEFDAASIARSVLDVARATLADAGPCGRDRDRGPARDDRLVGPASGVPVGPAISWQDLRTVVTCLMLRDQGVSLAPNESATKLAFLLDLADPDRSRDLCFGTMDTWIAWTLSAWEPSRDRRHQCSGDGPADQRRRRVGPAGDWMRSTSRPECSPRSSTRPARSARRPRSTARPRFAGSWVTSRRRSSDRDAHCRVWRKSRSEPGASSTRASGTIGRRSPGGELPAPSR